MKNDTSRSENIRAEQSVLLTGVWHEIMVLHILYNTFQPRTPLNQTYLVEKLYINYKME